MTDDSLAHALATLLEQERAALRQADFATLERLAPRKEACLQALRHTTPGAKLLAHLHDLSARNQVLLAAARDGLALAQATLAALSAPQHTATYGPDGQRACLGAPQQSLYRKF